MVRAHYECCFNGNYFSSVVNYTIITGYVVPRLKKHLLQITNLN